MPVSFPDGLSQRWRCVTGRAILTLALEAENQGQPVPNAPYAFPIPYSLFPVPYSLFPKIHKF
ncbi:hypothetical protein [Moorena producens]|uniref:hypothetical protein n=1 Tax=Moorena producens TaxID=1155739 RepID=UPI003C75DFA2